MALQLTVPTIFTAVDKLSPFFKTANANLTSFGQKAEAVLARNERAFNKLTPSLGAASKQMLSFASSAAIGAAIVGGALFSGKAIADYEVSLHSLQAVTGVSYKLFEGQIESIAKKSRRSSIDVAQSFEVIGSAMSQYLTDPKALGKITEAGITLSKASREELTPTLDNLTNIMNQFKLGANQAEYAINRLTAGEIVGSMRTSEVASSLQEFGASAKLANVNLGESVSLVEVLGRQMQHASVGNAGKNILVILQAAKGLAKRARAELTKNGVNMSVLMDNKNSLGTRLTELSKILKDPIAMVKVFGRENLTAGQIILSNLKTYRDWELQIRNTNQAQVQAATNSDTLTNRVKELKNMWTTYITTNKKASVGLNAIKTAIKYVTDNLDTIVTVGAGVLAFFAAWKTALIADRIYLFAYSKITALAAASTTTLTTAMETQTVVTGFGGAIQGVTGNLIAAEGAAAGFFSTLSAFVIPAALATMAGWAMWKSIDGWREDRKRAADVERDVKQHFNRKTSAGRMSSFADKNEESAFQKWFVSQAKLGVKRDGLTRTHFDDEYGSEYNQLGRHLDAVLSNKTDLTKPGVVPMYGGGGTPSALNHSLNINLHDPNNMVKDTTVTGPFKIPVKVTNTQGQK